jgi:type III pantothenate kinase
MQTTLCLDFGNTRLKCALFNGNELQHEIVLDDDATPTIENILSQYKPSRSILSSVINHNPELEIVLASKTKLHKLSNQSKLPFTTPVGKPETIGADRLALVAAAVYFYPKQHNLDISLG